MANARKLAVKALIRVETDGAYSNITLGKILSVTPDITPADKALATALFYGVLDRKITIDYILSQYVKTPVSKISAYTLQNLRVAFYQLLYMDKIPQSAAVNEAVKLIKSSKERYNASFVNGVLRNALRNPVKLPDDDSVKSISVRSSCPEWIVNSFIDDYGIDTAKQLLLSSLSAPPVTLRVNTIKITAETLVERLSKEGITASIDSEATVTVDGGIDISNSNCYKEGLFHVQDAACQRTAEILSPKAGERVLDICSAPGGKTFTMAQLMQNNGELIATDLYEKRVELVKKGAERLGLTCIKTSVCDATKKADIGTFDAILCDVPCSGLGVIRRKPEIKYKDTEDFGELEFTQQKILGNAASYLKKGGRLLYSTCTLRSAENDGQVKAFLDKNTGYELQYQHTYMPHIDGTDGFYCALIRKSE